MLFDSLEKISKVMRQAPLKKNFVWLYLSGGRQFYVIFQGFNKNCVLNTLNCSRNFKAGKKRQYMKQKNYVIITG